MEHTLKKPTYTELSEKELLEKFTFIQNPNTSSEKVSFGSYLFEIGGDTETFIESINPAHVWTIIRSMDICDILILGSGKRYNNRVHYLVSLEPVPEGIIYGSLLV